MSDEHSVSRRTSLKSFGAMGAAVVFGSAMPPQAGRKPAGTDNDVQAANVADLAVGRMAKGHS